MAEAADEVVVDHAGGLHQRVRRGRTHEPWRQRHDRVRGERDVAKRTGGVPGAGHRAEARNASARRAKSFRRSVSGSGYVWSSRIDAQLWRSIVTYPKREPVFYCRTRGPQAQSRRAATENISRAQHVVLQCAPYSASPPTYFKGGNRNGSCLPRRLRPSCRIAQRP